MFVKIFTYICVSSYGKLFNEYRITKICLSQSLRLLLLISKCGGYKISTNTGNGKNWTNQNNLLVCKWEHKMVIGECILGKIKVKSSNKCWHEIDIYECILKLTRAHLHSVKNAYTYIYVNKVCTYELIYCKMNMWNWLR